MKYSCEKCAYETKNKYDYERHTKTAKHLQKTQKIYSCDKCHAEYNIRQSLYAHKKKCQKTTDNLNFSDNDLKMQLLIMQHENEKIKKDLEIEKIKIEYEQKQNQLLKDIVNKSAKTTDTALKITSKTISTLKYANEHFKNAPPLLPIENCNVLNYDLDDEDDKKKLV